MRLALALGLLGTSMACGDGFDEGIWTSSEWSLSATLEPDALVLEATAATVHDNDFIHVSIRKAGWDNQYTIERSPAPDQPERDWSRPHRWFGEFYGNTYLEGSLHDGEFKRPPRSFRTYEYHLDLEPIVRTNWPDQRGSEFQFITRGYSYADNNSRHPGFGPGDYEVEVYAWYTGDADDLHPAANGESEVQYIHYERRIITTRFQIPE